MKKIRKYQHLKCTFWIFVAAIIVLIVSLLVPCSPWNSILQNVFAGLVTGIVVTLISSLKGKELKDAEIEDQFFKMVHDLYISSRREYMEYRKVWHEKDDGVYSEVTYELITELQAIESFIESKDKDNKAGFTIQEFLINSLHPIRSGKAVSLKTDSRFPHVRNGGFLMPGLRGHERRNTHSMIN